LDDRAGQSRVLHEGMFLHGAKRKEAHVGS
jgi:hypothetical protein